MTLIGGFRYFQEDDPGSVGAGLEWIKPSTGTWKMRNPENSAWIEIGNMGQENAGLMSKAGGTATGPFLGATGWAPDTSPDVKTSLKLDGRDVALKSDLGLLRRSILDSIQSRLNETLSKITNAKDLAFKFGVGHPNHGGTGIYSGAYIPLPSYPGGGIATSSEVVLVMVSNALHSEPGTIGWSWVGDICYAKYVEAGTDSKYMVMTTSTNATVNPDYPATPESGDGAAVNYCIICQKSS